GRPSAGNANSGGGSAIDINILSIWAAGTPPTVFPEGMGRAIKKNQDLTFNMHFHPNGRAATDHSKVGIYFGKGTLGKTIVTGFAANIGILVPAGTDNVESNASYVFSKDSRIISFFPHMHLRGKDMTYTLTYPDGRREILLRVPRYDFHWQWIYYPEMAIEVPRGSRIDLVAHWDNSASNRNNPDPTRTVEFGEGTDAEMMIGFFDYVVEDPRPPTSSQDKLNNLLAGYPSQSTYTLDLRIGPFPSKYGIHIPKDGTGTFHIVEGDMQVTITLRNINWNGSDVTMEGRMVRLPGATFPIGIRARVSDEGDISGKIFLGRVPPAGVEPRGPSVPFTGKRWDQPRVNQ
ncbi:MAG TPA: hypothetical protein VFV34_12150, partial [Blastocatellia bacterium]|nr:hypothetical protein [Blastocatellia bacterium]